MPKCPVCGKEMEKTSEKNFYCNDSKCGAYLEKFSFDDVKEGEDKAQKAERELDQEKANRSTKEKVTDWFKGQKEKIETKTVQTVEAAPGKMLKTAESGAIKGTEWLGKQTKGIRVTGGMVAKEFIIGIFAGPSMVFNIWLFLTIAFQIAPTFFPTIDTLSTVTGAQLHATSTYYKFIFPSYRRINEQWLSINYWSIHMVALAIIWPFVSVIQVLVALMNQAGEIPIASGLFYRSAGIPRTIGRASLYSSGILLAVAGMMLATNYVATNLYNVQYCPPEVPFCPTGSEAGTKIGEVASLEIDDTALMQGSVKQGETLTTVIKLTNKNEKIPIEGVSLKIYEEDQEGNPKPDKTWQSTYSCYDTNPCTIQPNDYVEVMVDITGLNKTGTAENWERKPLVIKVNYKLKTESTKQYYIYRSDKDVTLKSPEHVRGAGPIDVKLVFYPNEYSVMLEKAGTSRKNSMPILMGLQFVNNYYGEANVNEINISQVGINLLAHPDKCDEYSVEGTNDKFFIRDSFKLEEKIESEPGYPQNQKLITCKFNPPEEQLSDSRLTITFTASIGYDYSEKRDTATYVYTQR
jgi:hypothetical protein